MKKRTKNGLFRHDREEEYIKNTALFHLVFLLHTNAIKDKINQIFNKKMFVQIF